MTTAPTVPTVTGAEVAAARKLLGHVPASIRGFSLSQFCDNPHECFSVPEPESDFRDAPELAEIGAMLIDRHAELFDHINQYGIIVKYLWKQKGGAKAGNPTLGKCAKLSGATRYFAESDFLIWLAADHHTTFSATNRQVEAVIFHELKHVGAEIDEDTGELKGFTTVGHELEIFKDEIDVYGLWRLEMQPIARAMAVQLSLMGED
jgi:hypothetical protein